MFVNNEKGFVNKIDNAINEWLSSRPPPKDHTRFFHGTRAGSMTSLLEFGIDIAKFQDIGDFGPGFYCADKMRTTLRCAFLSSFAEGHLASVAPGGPHGPPMRAAVIYFDVKNEDRAGLKKLELDEGDEWTTYTEQCLAEDGHLEAYRGERYALKLGMGKLVQNPDQVENHQATSEAFEDRRKQFALRVLWLATCFLQTRRRSALLFSMSTSVSRTMKTSTNQPYCTVKHTAGTISDDSNSPPIHHRLGQSTNTGRTDRQSTRAIDWRPIASVRRQ
jgi:hypothetical protein